jgi:hypothetical protein
MDEFIKGQSIAGRVLQNALEDTRVNYSKMIANLPTNEERFAFASANHFIGDLAKKIHEMQDSTPKGMYFVVLMETPDRRQMAVTSIQAIGYNAFSAEGFIDNLKCVVVGHVSQIKLFCTYEEGKATAHRPGFIIKASEPQPAPEQQAQDTTQPVAESPEQK